MIDAKIINYVRKKVKKAGRVRKSSDCTSRPDELQTKKIKQTNLPLVTGNISLLLVMSGSNYLYHTYQYRKTLELLIFMSSITWSVLTKTSGHNDQLHSNIVRTKRVDLILLWSGHAGYQCIFPLFLKIWVKINQNSETVCRFLPKICSD